MVYLCHVCMSRWLIRPWMLAGACLQTCRYGLRLYRHGWVRVNEGRMKLVLLLTPIPIRVGHCTKNWSHLFPSTLNTHHNSNRIDVLSIAMIVIRMA